MPQYDLNRGIGIEIGFDKDRISSGSLMKFLEIVDPVFQEEPISLGPENRNWVVKPDPICGYKVCSPSLSGSARSLDLLAMTINLFDFNGLSEEWSTPITKKCFYHLHIDVTDLSPEELLKVVQTGYRIEKGIFDLLPKSRRDTEEAVPLHKIFKKYPTKEGVLGVLKDFSKASLNVSNYMGRGTLEVRYAAGTSNSNKVNFWIILWTSLIEKTLNFGPPKENLETIEDIVNWLEWPEDDDDEEDLLYTGRCFLLGRKRVLKGRKRNALRAEMEEAEAVVEEDAAEEEEGMPIPEE